MRLTIKLREFMAKPLLAMEIIVFVLCFFQILLTVGTLILGTLIALPFAVITLFMVRYICLSMLLPGAKIRDEYEFTPDTLTQTRKGQQIKQISMGYGLHVYRYAGLMRSTLVFSRRELPQGELLKIYKKDPEVVLIPYIPRKMPKLKRYFDKSSRI